MLRDREADVLRFAHDLRVPPTSNQAERDLRPAKIQQKISGRLTSEPRTADRYRIRGYLSTAAKHGKNTMSVLREASSADPGMPPRPRPRLSSTQTITSRPAHHRPSRHTPLPQTASGECLRRRVWFQLCRSLFPTTPLRTRRASFPSNGLSSDYAVSVAVRFSAWMASWQVVQTTRVLRRRFTMSCAHAGCAGPGWPRSASFRMW